MNHVLVIFNEWAYQQACPILAMIFWGLPPQFVRCLSSFEQQFHRLLVLNPPILPHSPYLPFSLVSENRKQSTTERAVSNCFKMVHSRLKYVSQTNSSFAH